MSPPSWATSRTDIARERLWPRGLVQPTRRFRSHGMLVEMAHWGTLIYLIALVFPVAKRPCSKTNQLHQAYQDNACTYRRLVKAPDAARGAALNVG